MVFYIKLDWITEYDNDFEYKAYVSSGNGKLLSVKDNELYLSENIQKVCFSCTELLNESGSFYNSSLENNNLTICFSVNLNNSLNHWGICLRRDYSIADRWYYQRILIWLISGLLLLTSVFILLYLSSKSEKPWNSVKQLINNLAFGKFNENDFKEIKEESFNEIKNTLSRVNESLNKLTEYNKKAVSGNFDEQADIINFKHNVVRTTLSLYQQLEKTNNQLLEKEKKPTKLKVY